MQGKIIKIISNSFTVAADGQEYVCKSRGKFRNMNITPTVGDNVLFDVEKRYIMEILPRKNALRRPFISNIDQAVIIMSVKEPDFSTNLLDKLLVIAEFHQVEPVICLTKLDLLKNDEKAQIDEYIAYYQKIGYQVLLNTNLDEVKKIFKNKISVFTGQSGAGKSTLLNKLDASLSIKTDAISHALGRGKHTTRHVELLSMHDGLVADTPGFSSIDFNDMKKEDIKDAFVEFNLYRDECEYSDCMHQNEVNCMVKQKVEENEIMLSRYTNYLKFISK